MIFYIPKENLCFLIREEFLICILFPCVFISELLIDNNFFNRVVGYNPIFESQINCITEKYLNIFYGSWLYIAIDKDVGFVLTILYRCLLVLWRDSFKTITLEQFCCFLVFILVIGLAHFSGATLRRPNVSIWLSLILALMTLCTEAKEYEAQYHRTGLQC